MEKIFKNGYTAIPNEAFDELNGIELKILNFFINKYKINKSQPFYCYINWMAEHFTARKTSIITSLKRLQELGYINIKRVGKMNYYSIPTYKYVQQNTIPMPTLPTAYKEEKEEEEVIRNVKVAASSNIPQQETKNDAPIKEIKTGIYAIDKSSKEWIYNQLIEIRTIMSKRDRTERLNDLVLLLQNRYNELKKNVCDFIEPMYKEICELYDDDGLLKHKKEEIKDTEPIAKVSKYKKLTDYSLQELIDILQVDIQRYRSNNYIERMNMNDEEVLIALGLWNPAA